MVQVHEEAKVKQKEVKKKKKWGKPGLKEKFLVKVFTEGKKVVRR